MKYKSANQTNTMQVVKLFLILTIVVFTMAGLFFAIAGSNDSTATVIGVSSSQ